MKPTRVLIVDDAATTRRMLKDIFVEAAFEVVGEAEDGVKAVQKYRELKPDLVTMDIQMPAKGGIDATKEILAFDPAAIIIVFSVRERTLMMDAIDAGATDFVEKPFEAKDVLRVVDKVLAGRKSSPSG